MQASDVRERVGKRVEEFLSVERPRLDQISPDVGSLVDTVGQFMDGGKRLRAAFLYWGWRAGGGPDNDEIIAAAAAMEFLQACALIHDDVMDRSDSRRGRPSVHRQYAAHHALAGWTGEPEGFGTAAAILIGDLCLSWADTLLLSSGLPAEALTRGKPVYDEMRVELMAGQYLDILEQARGGSTVESALQVATYKAAKYTIERPLHLGAALTGAAPEVIAALRSYGLGLGQAFQLRDDLLGVFGDPSRTGKPTGDDLREGKRTALIALTLSDCDRVTAERFEARFGDRNASQEQVAELTAIIAGTSARARVEEMISTTADEARAALADVAVQPEARAVLLDLVDAVTVRTA